MTAEPGKATRIRPLWWNENAPPNGALELIDQTQLPSEYIVVRCTTAAQVWEAIKQLKVRGAPAIGVAAAYGVIVGLDDAAPTDADWHEKLRTVCDYLATSRPTAVNLFRALNRMKSRADALSAGSWREARAGLLQEAHAVRNEDAAMCRAIGEAGWNLIPDEAGVITHCNAGALATSEYGTALAVMYAAHERGKSFRVFVGETRPLLQGSRLTAWELERVGIETILICDSMAALIMKQGKANLVITGADRIAANGDTANKIGTYGLAVLAKAHGLPFYIAAPSTTFDFASPNGASIPIEVRDGKEIRTMAGHLTAPIQVACYNPAFDVTPADYITGFITERGIMTCNRIDDIRPACGRR